MNLAGIDKYDIMFFELIAAALNAVGYIAVQMNQNFVEIMVSGNKQHHSHRRQHKTQQPGIGKMIRKFDFH